MKRSTAAMGTIVTLELPRGNDAYALERGLDWFRQIEAICTRFDPASELMRLCARPGEAVEVSAALFEAVRFAVAVAEASGGAFDPTAGAALAARGSCGVPAGGTERAATFRDVAVDQERKTITLRRPLTLDLGAVAKGLAMDMAARELRAFADFAIDAGGDLYLAGRNGAHECWTVGIRDPFRPDAVYETRRVTQGAVCTSGLYERGEHILDARAGAPATACASVTVLAPTALAADALATAAFVLGPEEGLAWLEGQGVAGMILGGDGRRLVTEGFDT